MTKKPDRNRRQSVFFFAILYILAAGILWFRTEWLRPADLVHILALAGGFVVTVAVAPFLTPVFNAVTALTRRLGSFIFAVISLLVYFLILSPMAVVMRLAGKRFLPLDSGDEESWYVDWTPGESLEKQF